MDKKIVDKICSSQNIEYDELESLLECSDDEMDYLAEKAREVSRSVFGNRIYLRGLIEISSHCKNDCYYCGLRRSNHRAERYRLTPEEILDCCETGYGLGFRTFVLQGGEDGYYSDDVMVFIISEIKRRYPQCAVTLSLGERSEESYKKMFDAGADRYLLRHETANEAHYKKMHPENMSLENRKRCLFALRSIGYQTGCGIMVGSPYQNVECIYEDICFMKELKPHMIGIGPFVKQSDTPFGSFENGSVRMTLLLLSVLRLIFPKVLLPATTALGTMDPLGREKGILAGANVLMPNLSPVSVRKKYALYDNKICTGEEAAECSVCLERRVERIGYVIDHGRGDSPVS